MKFKIWFFLKYFDEPQSKEIKKYKFEKYCSFYTLSGGINIKSFQYWKSSKPFSLKWIIKKNMYSYEQRYSVIYKE